MKVISLQSLLNTDRHVVGEGFTSTRFLLEKDKMGFSLHYTNIPQGGPYHWHYKHHLEACYCIKGEGEITNLGTGEMFTIVPDTLYVLDNHDDHTFGQKNRTATTAYHNDCFNPDKLFCLHCLPTP